MSDPVQIGLREVYDAVLRLDEKFDAHKAATELRLALIDRDIAELKEKDSTKGRRSWEGKLAILTAVAALIGAFVAPLVVH